MSKLIVQFKNTVQVSPDDWERITYTAEFDETTTLAQVREWGIKTYVHRTKLIMPDLILINPELPTE